MRHDGGFAEGDVVSPYYDPMLAKLITWGPDRPAALGRMVAALEDWTVHGVVTNLGLLRRVLSHEAFCAGETHTGFIAEHLSDGEPLGDPPVAAILSALAVAEALGIGAGTSGPTIGGGPRDPAPFTTLGPWRGVQ